MGTALHDTSHNHSHGGHLIVMGGRLIVMVGHLANPMMMGGHPKITVLHHMVKHYTALATRILTGLFIISDVPC